MAQQSVLHEAFSQSSINPTSNLSAPPRPIRLSFAGPLPSPSIADKPLSSNKYHLSPIFQILARCADNTGLADGGLVGLARVQTPAITGMQDAFDLEKAIETIGPRIMQTRATNSDVYLLLLILQTQLARFKNHKYASYICFI